MDSKKAEALRKKYWEGKTSLNEESELKAYHKGESDSDPEHVYFNSLNKKSAQNPLGEEFDKSILDSIENESHELKPKRNLLKYWYIAASLALVISVSIIFKNQNISVKQPENIVETDTYEDPEQAFEETKRALLLISSSLNQTSEYTSQFSKFEQSQNNLKQE